MADNHCADFGAKPTSVAGLCLMGPGENASVVTYDDGTVATITEPHADQPAGFYVEPAPSDTDRTPIKLGITTPSIDRMKELQGDQLGSCSTQGMGSKFSFTTLSSSMSWPSATKVDIRRLIWGSNAGNRPNLVITCSDPTYQGLAGVNNSSSNRQLYVDAVSSLNKSCGAFDGAHCEALRESLSAAAGLPPPSSSSSLFLEILKYGGTLLGVAFAFGVVVPWLQKWLGPKDGGHGGGGGGGGGGGKDLPELTRDEIGARQAPSNVIVDLTAQGAVVAEPSAAPIDDRSTWMTPAADFSEILEPEIQGRFGNLGVVTAAKGGLMYKYQATIDGVRVGLPSALKELSGVSWTSDDFEKKVGEVALVIPVPFAEASSVTDGISPLVDLDGDLFEDTLETVKQPNQTHTAILDGQVVDIGDHPGLDAGGIYESVAFEGDVSSIVAYEKIGEMFSGVDFGETGNLAGVSFNEPFDTVNSAGTPGTIDSYGQFEKRFGFTEETPIEEVIIKMSNGDMFSNPKLGAIYKNLRELSKDPRFQKVYNLEQQHTVLRHIVETRLGEENGQTIKTWQELDEEVWRSKIQPERLTATERSEKATQVTKGSEARKHAEKAEEFDLEKDVAQR